MASADSITRLFCGKCGQDKSLDCFYIETRKGYARTTTHGRRLPCKECHRASSHDYSKDYCRRPEVKERRKKSTNKGRKRGYQLKSKYGLTTAQYESLLRLQNGECAICGKTYSIGRDKRMTPLCVDHDHGTGRIRGLLCSGCNRLLAKIGDNMAGVMRFANYLANPPELG